MHVSPSSQSTSLDGTEAGCYFHPHPFTLPVDARGSAMGALSPQLPGTLPLRTRTASYTTAGTNGLNSCIDVLEQAGLYNEWLGGRLGVDG